ncbi:hypothetical protein Pint_29150 [Pistacia integerrima]|uniref:Uncharacterized protein n=1 Tax=Pistacia integerrima TaxID=434235 RepID=A0ACC0WXP1_9ROSI|nr:hypothetical protein Pint_29150 [Pistacia integerrima]
MVQVHYFINFLKNQFQALVVSLTLSKRKFQELMHYTSLAKHQIPSKGDVFCWAKLSGIRNSCLPLKFKALKL